MTDHGVVAEAAVHDFDFFVSRAGADRDWAEWIAWQIEEFEYAPGVRYRVLLQDWEFVPGSNWAEWMEYGIGRAAQVIPVLSPDYVAGQGLGAAEWQAFWRSDPQGRERRVVPVRVRPCAPDGLFGSVVGIDLVGLAEPEAAERLREGIRAASTGRSGPPVHPGWPDAPRAVPRRPRFPGGWIGPAAVGGAAVGGIAGRASGGLGGGSPAGDASGAGWEGNAGTENAGAGWQGQPGAEHAGAGWQGQPGAEHAGAGWQGQPGAGHPGPGWQGQPGTGQPGPGWQGQPGAGQPGPGWQGQPGAGWHAAPPGGTSAKTTGWPRTPKIVAAVAAVIGIVATLLIVIDPFGDPKNACTVDNYVTSVRLAGQDVPAGTQKGFISGGTAEGPNVTVPPTTTVVNGGSLQVPITASGRFVKLLVGIEAAGGSEPGVAECYYEIAAPAPGDTEELVLTIAQDLPSTTFTLNFAAVDEQGRQGLPGKQTAEAIRVATGQVQVSLSWDAASDVDLHVVDPNGDEVYYQNDTVPSGGLLDLDSNADCVLDNKNNENIAWTSSPAGVYTVRVDYYDSCDVSETNYVVTVHVAGQDTQVFNGRLTGTGDQGSAGSGDVITTFTVD